MKDYELYVIHKHNTQNWLFDGCIGLLNQQKSVLQDIFFPCYFIADLSGKRQMFFNTGRCNLNLMRPITLSTTERQNLWWKELKSSALIIAIMWEMQFILSSQRSIHYLLLETSYWRTSIADISTYMCEIKSYNLLQNFTHHFLHLSLLDFQASSDFLMQLKLAVWKW